MSRDARGATMRPVVSERAVVAATVLLVLLLGSPSAAAAEIVGFTSGAPVAVRTDAGAWRVARADVTDCVEVPDVQGGARTVRRFRGVASWLRRIESFAWPRARAPDPVIEA